MNKFFVVIIFMSLGFYSCLDRDSFSEIPEIQYDEMTIDGSSIIVKISFTDGDGDIGYKENENQYPYGPCDPHHNDLFVDPYYLKDGEWVIGTVLDYDSKCYPVPVPDTGYYPDTVGYYYRVVYLTPEGKDKSLEGDIYITLNQAVTEFPDDTVKFSITLYDRALHKSNTVETETIITPKL